MICVSELHVIRSVILLVYDPFVVNVAGMGKVTGLAHNVNYLEILCYLAGRRQAHFVGHSSYLTVQVVLKT